MRIVSACLLPEPIIGSLLIRKPGLDLPVVGFAAILTAISQAIVDYAMATGLHLTPLFRLPVLVAAFALSYLIVSRQFSIFTEADFGLLENTRPRSLQPGLRLTESMLIPTSKHLREVRV
jgi:hypothetical protein